MDIHAHLTAAAADLQMPSESEYPFEVWVSTSQDWPDVEAAIATQAPQPEPVEIVDLAHLFRNVAYAKSWHDDLQQAQVPKFQALMAALNDALTDLRVYRIGTVEVEVYILGKFAGGIAGLRTKLVET
ncbi:MAG: nuclease [Oscillatoriales cyanobacterium SM2_1_8]|nr:nuclease [Oscillatoriales cyanobacterium SM2_1_8]